MRDAVRISSRWSVCASGFASYLSSEQAEWAARGWPRASSPRHCKMPRRRRPLLVCLPCRSVNERVLQDTSTQSLKIVQKYRAAAPGGRSAVGRVGILAAWRVSVQAACASVRRAVRGLRKRPKSGRCCWPQARLCDPGYPVRRPVESVNCTTNAGTCLPLSLDAQRRASCPGPQCSARGPSANLECTARDPSAGIGQIPPAPAPLPSGPHSSTERRRGAGAARPRIPVGYSC